MIPIWKTNRLKQATSNICIAMKETLVSNERSGRGLAQPAFCILACSGYEWEHCHWNHVVSVARQLGLVSVGFEKDQQQDGTEDGADEGSEQCSELARSFEFGELIGGKRKGI